MTIAPIKGQIAYAPGGECASVILSEGSVAYADAPTCENDPHRQTRKYFDSAVPIRVVLICRSGAKDHPEENKRSRR